MAIWGKYFGAHIVKKIPDKFVHVYLAGLIIGAIAYKDEFYWFVIFGYIQICVALETGFSCQGSGFL